MHPHRETFGFTSTFSFDWYVALLTMVAWLLSSDRKFVPLGATPVFLYLFALWICVTTYFALDRDYSYELWDRTIKSLLLVLFVMLMTTNTVRLHAFIWTCIMALGYFAVKGAGFVVLSGGGIVYGPVDSMINDNNHLSVALASLLPLLLYLYRTSARSVVRVGCALVAISIIITIVGTYSRGGLLALGAMGTLMVLRSRAKIATALAGILAVTITLMVVPPAWIERMSTIGASTVDASVQGRYQAWDTSWNLALARPTGGGFRSIELQPVWNSYTSEPGTRARAAHNMYFQVLGDHGFIGLGLFLAMILSAIRNTQVATKIGKATGSTTNVEMANALQLSIAGILIGSVTLSLAYFDMFLCFYGLTFSLRRILTEPRQHEALSLPSSSYAKGRPTR
jgi:probable O-glycosylation ligase (exosortase A-associated)